MGPEHPEKPDQRPSGEPEGEEAWKNLTAELMGRHADAEGLAAADKETREMDVRLRRQEFRKAMMDASDVIVRAPAGFPDKTAILDLLVATERLTTEIYGTRLGQLDATIGAIREALAVLEAETKRLDPDRDTA